MKSLIKPSQEASVKTDPVQLLGCRPIKALGRHCQTSASRTELIEQHIDAMLQQDVTGPEADDMDDISDDSQPEKAILSYLGGYARPDAKLVELKSWGMLKVPSMALMKLLEFLVQCVQNQAAKLCVDIYTDILNKALAV